MIAFFVILALLMVLVAFSAQWAGPRRRIYVDRDVVVPRRTATIEEEVVDMDEPVASRRVVRRRRTY